MGVGLTGKAVPESPAAAGLGEELPACSPMTSTSKGTATGVSFQLVPQTDASLGLSKGLQQSGSKNFQVEAMNLKIKYNEL